MRNIQPLPDNLLKDLIYCNRSRCGFCETGCPTYIVSRLEPLSARGRNTVALSLIEGIFPISQGLTERFLICTLCGFCEERCPLQVSTLKIIKNMRRYFVDKGYYNPYVKSLIESIRNFSNPYGKQNEERGKWVNDLMFQQNSKTLFYGGCVYSYMLPQTLKSIAQIIIKTGKQISYLGSSEMCCGYPLFICGYQREFEEIAMKNVNLFLKNDIQEIIVACPACAETFSRYPEYVEKADFKVYHVLEFLNEAIEQGQIQPSREVSLKVTYHDPCHLARYLRIVDEPRKIIRSVPGVELREMFHAKFEARCCGGGGGLLTVNPKMSLQISMNRIQEAKETNAEAIVTACPTCETTLNAVIKREKRKDLIVVDIIDLLSRSL